MNNYFTVIILCFVVNAEGYSIGIDPGVVNDEYKVIDIPDAYNYDLNDDIIYDDNDRQSNLNEDLYGGDDDEPHERLHRQRRQGNYSQVALHLASKSKDSVGGNIPVGKVFPRFDIYGAGSSPRDFKGQLGIGAGSVLYRSKNEKHSIGAGAYIGSDQSFTSPSYGVGVSYKFSFK